MKVYRYLEKKELENILADNLEDIGSEYINEKFKDVNTHRYKKGIKYLHFFRHKEDIEYLIKSNFLPSGEYYICEFNIPAIYLITGFGRGLYEGSGYDTPNHIAHEFKLPAKLLQKDFLISYEIHPESLKWKNYIESASKLNFSSLPDKTEMDM